MSTCFLKRFLPFMLTLVVGLGLGSLFQRGARHHAQSSTRLCSERSFRTTDNYQQRHAYDDSTPLVILFEPPTYMTPSARAHETYGVVQLLVEYGADGKARVLERITTQPDGLTEEAERVAERTQFRPETHNGVPVTVTREQAYYFNLGRF